MNFKQAKPGALIPGKRPFVIAHRGAALQAPENTIEAFDLAIETRAADAIELDVRLSKDGELVVIHDATVNRTTNGAGAVNSLTLRQLKRLDAGHHFTKDGGKSFPYRGRGVTISTLDEVFTRYPDQGFFVELKDSSKAAAGALSKVIEKHNAFDRVIVVMISVKHRTGKHLRLLDQRIKTGHTSREISTLLALSKLRLGGLFKSQGYTIEVPMRKFRISLPTRSFIDQAHAKGISVLVWTINDAKVMRKCLALGVDGIFTDDVNTLRQLIRER
jgi:glycerophosphoryl diester phosphodiesterase